MPLVTLSSSAASEVWIGATASGDLKCGQKVFRLVWRFMLMANVQMGLAING